MHLRNEVGRLRCQRNRRNARRARPPRDTGIAIIRPCAAPDLCAECSRVGAAVEVFNAEAGSVLVCAVVEIDVVLEPDSDEVEVKVKVRISVEVAGGRTVLENDCDRTVVSVGCDKLLVEDDCGELVV